MRTPLLILWAATLTAVAVAAEPRIESIPPDWGAVDRQRLDIASAEASASLGEQYASGRIHDGDRKTKWVCPTKPTAAAPQWVTLALTGGLQEVSAVAVFGERIDNDGVLDADVQVESSGGFKTVASVRAATTGSWLATFDPITTGKVRLLVLRSAGPTDHTDVWEMEVFGPPLSAGELKAVFTERLTRMRTDHEAAAKWLQTLAARGQTLPAAFRQAEARIRSDAAELERELSRWEDATPDTRTALLRRAGQTTARAAALAERSQRASQAESRAPALAAARAEMKRVAKPGGSAGAVSADVGPQRSFLANDRIGLAWDARSNAWSVAWAEGTEVFLAGARFSVEADGAVVTLGPPQQSARRFQDALGVGQELRQVWQSRGLLIERELRLYDGQAVLTLGGRITNQSDRDVKLGTTKLLELGDEGAWWTGSAWEPPASVYLQGHSLLRSTPFAPAGELSFPREKSYRSSGVLLLASREPSAALLVGYVRADEAAPDLAATFRLDEGGVKLGANSRFLGRVLGPRETVELNRLCLAGGNDAFPLLEEFGAAMAKCSARPARRGATSLWCSWYAHRMGMTEEKVLANAEVAAKHFKPLGLEIMQLDHGWQRGDITGDWVPNERFPHGLKWLADELQKRHGLRLGLWISPTDVAETSELFKQHPDWLLKGDDGKPRVNWRWYWKPNPDCFVLDATQPEVYDWIADTFRRLTSEGASYFKIDFIAASGGEHFHQRDPKATRGWTNLRRAMEAIREGAGGQAWIRYCQPPPILSAGLADSAYGGDDTLDAGVPGYFHLLSDNARALAAGYWLNDRPYHREVCDMSVRMHASVEETRVRAAIMTLANCSISWSDELCYLPPSRIRLMQQCLPPGNPPMRPLDLLERDVPSVWHLKVKNDADAWEVVGLFNFDKTAASRTVRFEQLGLDPKTDYAVFEFWEEKFLGVLKGGVELVLPSESSRIVSIRKLTGAPQLIGTDMHLLQGYHELKQLKWDPQQNLLSGRHRRAPGLTGKAFIYLPAGYSPKFEFPLSPASARLTHVEDRLWMQEIEFRAAEVEWAIPFDRQESWQVAPRSGGTLKPVVRRPCG